MASEAIRSLGIAVSQNERVSASVLAGQTVECWLRDAAEGLVAVIARRGVGQ